MLPRRGRQPDERTSWRTSAPFLVMHLVPLLVVFTGIDRTAAALFAVTWTVRTFCITAGYHRYFAHRSYRLARVPQALLAFGGLTAVQKGPLWWASHHRDHHRYADTERDPHSPQAGFWWAHMGWITSGKFGDTDYEAIDDFARFPELVWMNRHDWVGPWSLAAICFLVGGWSGLVVGFFASTVLLWHATFCVNSLAHLRGRRRYATNDSSRNNVFVALIAMGEGWHNNHHHHPSSARQGFRWWEIDPTYYLLRVLGWVGIVRDLRQPPAVALGSRRLRDGAVDVGMVRFHLSKAASVAEVATTGSGVVDLLEATADETSGLAREGRRAERVAV
jgi:stearoyl-CoA desaturase (Delta-9 desaturase)